MKRWLAVSAMSALWTISHLGLMHAQGVTQPFTYQGFLRQGGAPLNNPSQSMRFRIFGTLTGGTALWDSGALTVNVSNGLFTVPLNAPVSVWTGADRFLEIQVDSTTLSPRVRLGTTPYANTATMLNMFQSGTGNPDRMVITHSPGFPNWGLQYRDSDDSFHFLANGTTILRVGLVGSTTLQIPAGAAAGRVLTSDASGNASWAALPAGANAWEVSGTNIYNTNTGNVGIGTNAPGYLLDIRSNRAAPLVNIVNSGTFSTSDGVWVRAEGLGSWGIYGVLASPSGRAVYGYASNASGTGTAIYGRSQSADGHGGYFEGRVQVSYDSTTDKAILRLHETDANDFARLEFTNASTARKWHIAGFIGNTQAADRLNFWNSAGGDIMSIRGDGTVAVKVLEITGADLAEKFPVSDEDIQPGMVVEIDPDNPGSLRLCRSACSKRVAGVVAGANGLSKGIVLGNLEGSEHHLPIAMSGRVWVYAEATECAIEPGDLLTSSSRPGYARKATDLAQAQGAIIGKAMTGLQQGETGFVLVLVNLH